MSNVRKSLVLALGERYVLVLLSLLSSVVIARLLTPEDIGVYSVSLAVIGVAHVLRDFGIGNFLVQEKALTKDHIRTAFGFSLLIGGGLALIIFLSAPLIASFYAEARMVSTVQISALNFVVLPFCTISLALLRRDMRFSRTVPVTIAAALVGFLVTMLLAWKGVGPNSMAIGSVVGNAATGFGAWIARSDRSLLLPSLSEWRRLLCFGGQSSLSGIVTSVSLDANDLIVGKVLGFYPVAILSRAQGLQNLFHRDIMTTVRGVAFPAFAQAHRAGLDIEQQHARSVAVITALAWPFYGGVSIYALEALRLLAGPQWDAARPLVPLFCFAGALAALCNLVLTLLIAKGRVDLAMRADLLLQPLRIVLTVVAALVFRTTEAVAWAYLVAMVISVPLFYGIKRLDGHTDVVLLGRYTMASFLVSCVTLAPLGVHAYLIGFDRVEPANSWVVAAVISVAAALWVASVQVFRHPIAEEVWFRHLALSRHWRRRTGAAIRWK